MGYCSQTAQAAAEILHIPAESVLVASTGVIGMQLPMERLAAGIKAMAPQLDHSLESGTNASKAIMTTDTKNKEVAVQVEIGGATVTKMCIRDSCKTDWKCGSAYQAAPLRPLCTPPVSYTHLDVYKRQK